MSNCCHAWQVANSSNTWLIKQAWFNVLASNDVENKHFFVGFSYAEKDDTQSLEVSVSTDVFMKLMGPVFQLVCNVTCDKLFTSLGLV